jgi:hypothetical protein
LEEEEMITAKVFEVRDRATFIPVLAVKTKSDQYMFPNEDWLFRRAAYNGHIILTHLISLHTEFDPQMWDNRTMINAHQYIVQHWDDLHGGEVVDIEYILGEVDYPKESEIFGGIHYAKDEQI